MADVTVALTVHSETVVAGPTLRSTEAAIAEAEAVGYRVQRLIGLDRPSPATEAYIGQPALEKWQTIRLDCGDLGLARNALAQVAEAPLVAWLDADDMFSENWLVEGLAALAQGPGRILHPELNWFFDAARSILVNPDPSGPFYDPLYWRVGNYWDSLVLTPRDAVLAVPYRPRDRDLGLGFEDWCWNVETLSAGWIHAVVPDTIIFKRRRDNSLVTDLRGSKSLPWEVDGLAIDRLPKL